MKITVHKILLAHTHSRRETLLNLGFAREQYGFRFVLSAGFNPVWYDTLRFIIHTPEIAMVRFVVEDYDKTSKNDFVGQYVLPLTCMQQGKLGEPSYMRIRQHNVKQTCNVT